MGFAAAFRDLISFLVVNKAAPESDDDDDDDVAMGGVVFLSFSFPSEFAFFLLFCVLFVSS